MNKPFYKKWWFIVIVVIAVLAIIGAINDNGEDQTDVDNKDVEENEDIEVGEVEEEPEPAEEKDASDELPSDNNENEENDEEDVTWDDVKDKDKIVGKSDKDIKELTKDKPNSVRNDKTGKWMKLTTSTTDDFNDYALSYADEYMENGDVHYIVNFTLNTTTQINKLDSLIYVDYRERVDKEEHDANTIGGGMLLKSYVIYPDGDIEEIKE